MFLASTMNTPVFLATTCFAFLLLLLSFDSIIRIVVAADDDDDDVDLAIFLADVDAHLTAFPPEASLTFTDNRRPAQNDDDSRFVVIGDNVNEFNRNSRNYRYFPPNTHQRDIDRFINRDDNHDVNILVRSKDTQETIPQFISTLNDDASGSRNSDDDGGTRIILHAARDNAKINQPTSKNRPSAPRIISSSKNVNNLNRIIDLEPVEKPETLKTPVVVKKLDDAAVGGGVSNVDAIDDSQKLGVIFDIVFARDFASLFDPRNASSQFEFDDIASERDLGREQTGGEFAPALDNVAFMPTRDGALVNMISVPFSRWLPQRAGMSAILSGNEATVETKQPLAIGRGQVLSAAMQFNCRTINTHMHRFPAGAVLDAQDDQRLGRCGFYLAATDDPTGLEFGIVATNAGIWAVYNNHLSTRYELNLTYEAFSIYRRLAGRAGPQTPTNKQLIDARIEVDSSNDGEARYYVDNQLVWRVGQWGVLTSAIRSDPQNRLVSHSPAATSATTGGVVMPTSFALYIANTHIMDVGDALRPSGAADNLALVRYANLPGYYPPDAKFVDPNSNRASSLYGQGAIMGLKRLVVKRSGEVALAVQQPEKSAVQQQQQQQQAGGIFGNRVGPITADAQQQRVENNDSDRPRFRIRRDFNPNRQQQRLFAFGPSNRQMGSLVFMFAL